MNEWDSLAPTFSNDSKIAKKKENTAVWEKTINLLKEHNIKEVLDFGCGTGMFCNHLYEQGFSVEGIDSSKEMVSTAKKQYPLLPLRCGSTRDLTKSYDAIVSLMVFQFIENIEQFLSELLSHLKTGGLLIFAVHNEKYALSDHEGIVFSDIEKREFDKKTKVTFDNGASFTLCLRNPEFYERIFKPNTLVFKSFLGKKGSEPAKYLFMCFQKA